MTPARWLDTVPEPRYHVAVLGDVRLEMRARIPAGFAGLTADTLVYAPIEPLVAGSAVNFVRHARGRFASLSLLGRIGDDAFTPVIRAVLRDLGVADFLRAAPDESNGCAIMVSDPSARLLVAGDPAPRFTGHDLPSEAIEAADLLYADGYALLTGHSRTALLEAMASARCTALHLVPQDLPDRLSLETVLPALDVSDVVITELTTITGLLGDPPDLLAALDALTEHAPVWLLRHGPTGLEQSLAYQRGRLNLPYPTGYDAGVERAGFGDRLAASELYWYLSVTS